MLSPQLGWVLFPQLTSSGNFPTAIPSALSPLDCQADSIKCYREKEDIPPFSLCFFKRLIFILWVLVFCLVICLWITCIHCIQSQKKLSDPLELELWVVASSHVGARNWTQVLWKLTCFYFYCEMRQGLLCYPGASLELEIPWPLPPTAEVKGLDTRLSLLPSWVLKLF